MIEVLFILFFLSFFILIGIASMKIFLNIKNLTEKNQKKNNLKLIKGDKK